MGAETPPDQQYSLRWNDFHSSIISSFRHLRDAEDFVDVTLACEGRSFQAHKVVLSACSPYFKKLLKTNPCQHPIIILRDIQQRDMENLLRFMYNGEVNVGREQLSDFLKTAHMLQVKGLTDVVPPAHRLTAPNNSTTSEQKISTNLPLSWTTDRPEDLGESSSSPTPKRPRLVDNGGCSISRHSPSTNNGETSESLLGQALEGGPTITLKEKNSNSESPNHHPQSNGEDSNGSDTELSDHGDGEPMTPKTEPSDYQNLLEDHSPFHTNGSLMDSSRPASFPGALLGLQDYAIPGLGGLMAGPSGMHGNSNDFDANSGESSRAAPPDHQQPFSSFDVGSRPFYNMKYECPLCERVLKDLMSARVHLDEHYPRESLYCPVTECRKRFAHPNSVRNHMRQKHFDQWNIMKQIKWTL